MSKLTPYQNDDPFAFLDSTDEELNAPASAFTPDQKRLQTIAEAGFKEPCRKCGGSGRFQFYNGSTGECFACKGKGHKFFKTSGETRAQNRVKAETRKERTAQDNFETFCAGNPAIAAWIAGNPGFTFAVAMRQAVEKYGSLTGNQLAAVNRCLLRNVAWQEEKAAKTVARDTAALPIDVSALETAFNAARAGANPEKKIVSLKLRFAGFAVSPAKATSANAGALYVKDDSQTYLGKIMNGRFFQSRDCTPEKETAFRLVCDNPQQAAIRYGRETGSCSCCGRELTNKDSIAAGIGPVCATRYGWKV